MRGRDDRRRKLILSQHILKLSVIIVSYNVKHYLEQCLISVRRATEGIETEIYVVDNHSRDESPEYIMSRFPDINFISCILYIFAFY